MDILIMCYLTFTYIPLSWKSYAYINFLQLNGTAAIEASLVQLMELYLRI